METQDLEAQAPVSQETRAWSKWLRDSVKGLLEKAHPDSTNTVEDISNFITTVTSFTSAINDYEFQSDKAQYGIDITNAITNLGTAAYSGLDAYRKGEVKHPAYIAANMAGFALSVGRTALDLVGTSGDDMMKAKFAIDVAQMAVQVAKWGTKPSAAKAKGGEHAAMTAELQSLRSQVSQAASVVSARSASLESVRSARSAPPAIASSSRNSPPVPKKEKEKEKKKEKVRK
ncbi:hypothetical protein SAMN05443287_103632 [Micromonospora phaseoli]|uniref:Uncharacterized protein n=1 Tax=Micromonospora phaseoli TaxID=1144548 RepID=A0A1H6XTZ5_9ACTN|nr:hypothetical protein [Micromonospora phaseoli]PZW02256.1 hypothetical protein CLV64_102630 [Micromonospora phaseoli]GIJ75741.1 hypothetical protein Xph01_01730 [Micromonospora phaseoli]SEJ28372.1 hypothetical protein SAMN05443287_103632 [Micromonospora phaseoli]